MNSGHLARQADKKSAGHVMDEHVMNARVGSPALEPTATRGGKIVFGAALVIPAHTSHRYNTEVEKISELKIFW